MKKIIPLVLAMIVCAACSKTNPTVLQCDLEDGLEGTMAYAIEDVLNCSGKTAVRASVNSWVDSAGVCAQDSSKIKAFGPGAICAAIITSLGQNAGPDANAALNAKFPGWNCDVSSLVASATTVATAACSVVFPIMSVKK